MNTFRLSRLPIESTSLMLLNRSSFFLLAALLISVQGLATPHDSFLGFGDKTRDEEKQLEARFDSSLDATNLRKWMKRLTAHPHHVGSPYGKENAEFMLSLFRS